MNNSKFVCNADKAGFVSCIALLPGRISSEQKERQAKEALGWTSRIMGLTGVLGIILFFAPLHSPVRAFGEPLYSVPLAWDRSPNIEVINYNLYYGTASQIYTNSIIMGDVTNVIVPGLSSGVAYFFVLTAVEADGQESDFSNELIYTPRIPNVNIHAVPNGPFMLTVTGPMGRTYDIEATMDFTPWTVIGTVTLGAAGSLDFTDTNAANFPLRFYRTRDSQP